MVFGLMGYLNRTHKLSCSFYVFAAFCYACVVEPLKECLCTGLGYLYRSQTPHLSSLNIEVGPFDSIHPMYTTDRHLSHQNQNSGSYIVRKIGLFSGGPLPEIG